MSRRRFAAVMLLSLAGCASDGTGGGGVDLYGYYGYYDDWWYGGSACCVDYPGDIGPINPRPEHPIALPPGSNPRPEHPIATPPRAEPKATTSSSRSMPAPRASAPMRGGGGGGRGGGGRR